MSDVAFQAENIVPLTSSRDEWEQAAPADHRHATRDAELARRMQRAMHELQNVLDDAVAAGLEVEPSFGVVEKLGTKSCERGQSHRVRVALRRKLL